MENLNDLKNLWKSGVELAPAGQQQLDEQSLKNIVNTHLSKERQLLLNYVVKTSFWIFMVTAGFGHLLIRFWGDWYLTGLSLTGLLLYVPFTSVFMHRFKGFFGIEGKANADEALSVYQRIMKKQEAIKASYRFKMIFDILMIHISCLLLMLDTNAYAF